MSLDVYLRGPSETVQCRCRDCDHEHTREVCASLFDWNITHNLNRMADAAGIYQALWRPEEIGITHAAQLVEPLTAGLAKLVAEPDTYKAFNPENGWGNYELLVECVTAYLAACKEHPAAKIEVSR